MEARRFRQRGGHGRCPTVSDVSRGADGLQFWIPSAAAARSCPSALADDVLELLNSLKLVKRVLVGHSMGGEELTTIGDEHSERSAVIALR